VERQVDSAGRPGEYRGGIVVVSTKLERWKWKRRNGGDNAQNINANSTAKLTFWLYADFSEFVGRSFRGSGRLYACI